MLGDLQYEIAKDFNRRAAFPLEVYMRKPSLCITSSFLSPNGLFPTHSFRNYGNFSNHPGEGNRKIWIFLCSERTEHDKCNFKPFHLWIFSHCPSRQIQMWLTYSISWALLLSRVRRSICCCSSCKEDRDSPGQRLARNSLLINKCSVSLLHYATWW